MRCHRARTRGALNRKSGSSLLHRVGRLGDSVEQGIVALRRTAPGGGIQFRVVDQLHERLFHLRVLLQAEEAWIFRHLGPPGGETLRADLIGLLERIGLNGRRQQRG